MCYYDKNAPTTMITERCAVRMRLLTLLVNTGNLINERATITVDVFHGLLAPTAIFTTYVIISGYLLGDALNYPISKFMKIYGIVACATLQAVLSVSVFKEFSQFKCLTSAHVFNSILPLFSVMLLLADLVIVVVLNREIVTTQLPNSSAM